MGPPQQMEAWARENKAIQALQKGYIDSFPHVIQSEMLLLWQRLKQMEMLQLLDYSKACVQPAYDYFYLKFINDLKPVLDAFKAAHLFSPYMAASEDVSTEIDLIAWWKRHAIELPKWANAFKKVLLVKQSSAAAERIFSILQRFTAQQQSSLEDHIELSAMLQFNFART